MRRSSVPQVNQQRIGCQNPKVCRKVAHCRKGSAPVVCFHFPPKWAHVARKLGSFAAGCFIREVRSSSGELHSPFRTSAVFLRFFDRGPSFPVGGFLGPSIGCPSAFPICAEAHAVVGLYRFSPESVAAEFSKATPPLGVSFEAVLLGLLRCIG